MHGEPIVAYGWCDNGKSLIGHYVLTTTKKLMYDLKGTLISIEDREEVTADMEVFARSFSDDKTEPYDNYICGVRTVLFVSYLVTNCFIISGVIRHWNGPISNTNIPSTTQQP